MYLTAQSTRMILRKFISLTISFQLLLLSFADLSLAQESPVHTPEANAGEHESGSEHEVCARKESLEEMKECYHEAYEERTSDLEVKTVGIKVALTAFSIIMFFVNKKLEEKAEDPCVSPAMKVMVAGSVIAMMGEIASMILAKAGSASASASYAQTEIKQEALSFLIQQIQYIKAAEILKMTVLSVAAALNYIAVGLSIAEIVQGGVICAGAGKGHVWKNILPSLPSFPSLSFPLNQANAAVSTPELVEIGTWVAEFPFMLRELGHIYEHSKGAHAIEAQSETEVQSTRTSVGRLILALVNAIINTTLTVLIGLTYDQTLQQEMTLNRDLQEFQSRNNEDDPHEGEVENPATSTRSTTFNFPMERNRSRWSNWSMGTLWPEMIGLAQATTSKSGQLPYICAGKNGQMDVQCECKKTSSCFQVPTFSSQNMFGPLEGDVQKVVAQTNKIFKGEMSLLELDQDASTKTLGRIRSVVKKNEASFDKTLEKKSVPPLFSSQKISQFINKLYKLVSSESISAVHEAITTRTKSQQMISLTTPSLKLSSGGSSSPNPTSISTSTSQPAQGNGEGGGKEEVDLSSQDKNFLYHGGIVDDTYNQTHRSIWQIISSRYFKVYEVELEKVLEDEMIKEDNQKVNSPTP